MAEGRASSRIATLKGVGKQSPTLAALVMVLLESLNERLGLGLTAQEMMASMAILVILGSRIQGWLERLDLIGGEKSEKQTAAEAAEEG